MDIVAIVSERFGDYVLSEIASDGKNAGPSSEGWKLPRWNFDR